jgi:hypothetical protein
MKMSCFTVFYTIFICSLLSCKRENETNALQVKRELLTSDTLIYDEEIVNWQGPNQRVVFKKGSTSNAINIENAWIKYNLDSTFQALLSNFIRYDGKWELQNNGGKIRLTSTSLDFDETYNVIKLTKDTFEWVDPIHYAFYREVKK